jgi:diguanylate cyclase (GGDEF)-like protein/PAS domain S-box-containing protein
MDDLRKKAERQLSAILDQPTADIEAPSTLSLMHDLRVHQIELEMQNEELRNAQAELTASRDRFAQLYDVSPVGYCTLDTRGVVVQCNLTLCQLLGKDRGQLINYALGQHCPAADLPILQNMLKSRKTPVEGQIRLRANNPAQTVHHVLLKLQQINWRDNNSGHWLASISDISSLHRTTAELTVKSAAIENMLEGVIITDANNLICFVNKAFEQTTGYRSQEVLGRNPKLLQSGRQDADFYQAMWQSIAEEGHWRGELWNRRASGEVYPEWISIISVGGNDGDSGHFVGVFSDITTEENMRRRLHDLAYFDGVTNLPNRHLFMDRLNQVIADALRYQRSFALLFLDLDRFKNINDTLGHSMGDLLLVEVSRRIAASLRETDTVSRMGGDEFMILLPHVQSVSDARGVAEKLLDSMSNPIDLEGRHYYVSASIGISCYPGDGLDAEELIRHADMAMYQAKSHGRNTYRLYTPSLDEGQVSSLDLENDLRHALRLETLELYYQPQRSLVDDRWFGVEVLLRWNHPERGFIPPDEFIRIAEETGLIVSIGYWVLRQASEQYLAWRRAGLDVGRISINLSTHQFLQGNLVEQLRGILDETGMPPHRLGIEITESAAMPNFDYSVRTLDALRKMGIVIYIDDFGTGFSSLSHLRHLPIDCLKIDRTFVSEIPDNGDDIAIARAIIAMARSMNLQIVAEGIETSEQLEFLRHEGCHTGQGFLFSRPMPSNAIQALMGSVRD